MDDDDILYPIHLEVLMEAALHKKQDFVYVDWYEVSRDENNREFARGLDFRLDFELEPWMLILQNYIDHKCILHRRSLLEKTGMCDEELEMLIDWDMIRRLASVRKPYYVSSVTSEHIRYYSGEIIANRITGLRWRDRDRARKSLVKIINKTVDLPMTAEDLKKALVNSMLSFSYHHHMEMDSIIQAKDKQISALSVEISSLKSSLAEKTNEMYQLQTTITMQVLNKYQRVVGRLCPLGTRRRYYYELGLSGIRAIIVKCWRIFTWVSILLTKINHVVRTQGIFSLFKIAFMKISRRKPRLSDEERDLL